MKWRKGDHAPVTKLGGRQFAFSFSNISKV